MRNIQSFDVQELNVKEVLSFNGGATDPDGCSGCSWGVAFREFVGDFLSAMGKQGHIGQPGVITN